MNRGNLIVRGGATLVLGPLKCRVCDPYDPAYNVTSCNNNATDCQVGSSNATNYRLQTFNLSNLIIESGGRVVVYGNVFINGNSASPSIAGGLYVVGNLTTGTDISVTGTGGIYTTGTMVSSAGAATIGSIGTGDCVDVGPCAASASGLPFPYREYNRQGANVLNSAWSLNVQRSGNFNYCSNQNSFTVTIKDNGNEAGSPTGTLNIRVARYQAPNWVLVSESTVPAPASGGTATTTISLPAFGTAGYYTTGSEIFTVRASDGNANQLADNPVGSPIIKVVVPSFNRWLGISSSDWATGSNWCLGLPTSTQDLKINSSSNNPVISSTTTANAEDIRLEPSVSLTNNGSLNIYGDLQFLSDAVLASSESSTTTFKTGNGNGNHRSITDSNAAGSITFGNVTIDPSANLVLPSRDVEDIIIKGNLNINGTLNQPTNGSALNAVTASRSKIVFSGSAGQTITSVGNNAFYDVNINKTGGTITVTGGTMNLYGKMTFSSGTTLVSDGNLRIKSIASSPEPNGVSRINLLNGSVGPLPFGASITGNVVAERFIPTGESKYRYLTVPVSSSTAPSQMSTRYTYNAATSQYAFSSGSLVGGKGYAVLYRWWATNIALSFTGAPRQGPLKLICSAGCLDDNAKGWHLIGNPYPHPIYWEDKGASFAGGFGSCSTADCSSFNNQFGNAIAISESLNKVIAIRDNTSGRLRYATTSTIGNQTLWFGKASNNNCAGNAGNCNQYSFNGLVDIGQAFWIYVNGDGASLVIDETAKSFSNIETDPNFFNRVTPDIDETNNLNLALQIKRGNYSDFAFHQFSKVRRSNIPGDPGMELPKLWSESVNVYFLNEQNQAVLNSFSDGISEDTILPLGVKTEEAGEFSLDFDVSDDFKLSGQIYLVDTYEGVSHPIVKGQPYTFRNDEINKEVNSRFYISKNPVVASRENKITVYPNPSKDKVSIKAFGLTEKADLRILDMSGKIIHSEIFHYETSLDVSNYPAGLYFIRVENESGQFTEKLIKSR